MAITPDVITVTVDGITIGLSDEIGTLIQNGDFTPENLQPYMFCGNKTIGTTRYGSLSGSQKIYSGSAASQGLWFPVVCTTRYGAVTVEYALNDDIALENECYGRNILVYGASPTPEIHSGNTLSTQRVVTSIDFQKLYYDVELSADTISATRPSAVTKTYYKSGSLGKVKTIDNDVDTNIYVYDIFVDEALEEWYCILDYHFPGSDTANHQWKMCPIQKIDGNYGYLEDNLYDGWSSFALTRAQWRWGPNTAYTIYGGENESWDSGFEAFVDLGDDTVSHCLYDPYRAYCTCYVCGLDNALKQVANAGLRFKYNNTWYKPIGEGGVITGYTDDMTEESEWDDIEDVTGNTVPVTPPGPTPPTPPEGDDFDDHDMGAGSSISGMANLWLLTASQLSDLHSACSSAPIGFDPLNSFISVMGIGTNPEYLTHEIEYITPINIRMSDGTTWQTHVEGHIVSSQVSAFSFTGITVQRKYNNFLDFSPYATHEIFIPMCGWITLPDIAVDRSITVTYIPDIESLKCRAVVSVVDNSGNKCVIGEKDGIMGADVPFTNVGHSLFVGDAIVNGADVAGEAITMAIGAGFTKTNAKGGTYRPYEGFTLGGSGTLPGAIGNALVSGNINRTHFMSGNGTRIGFSDGENIQIKSVYHNVDIPPNYAHTVGLMCNKTGELSEFTGFTVCDNPHITFSALEAEKEEIKRLLEEGVIL